MSVEVRLTVNGTEHAARVPDRLTLADFLRDRLGLTGTRLGCEQGSCGACTVLLDGSSVRACLVLAAQADGCDVRTVEGLGAPGGPMSALQSAFGRHDAMQCGFCTPGMLMTGTELLNRPTLDEAEVRSALSGNLCRCTGYEGIVEAVLEVHRAGRTGAPEPDTGAPAAPGAPTGRSGGGTRALEAASVAAALAAVAFLARRVLARRVLAGWGRAGRGRAAGGRRGGAGGDSDGDPPGGRRVWACLRVSSTRSTGRTGSSRTACPYRTSGTPPGG